MRALWLTAALLLTTVGAAPTPTPAPALAPSAEPPYRAGVVAYSARDPVSGNEMPAIAFFPTESAAAPPLAVGRYTIDAVAGAAPAPGRFPLVIFSHGAGGDPLALHDLLTGLARRGFVAASVEHLGDSYRDQRDAGSDRSLIGRELQLSALIDATLAEPRLVRSVDPVRIGAAGYSAGGYDVFVLAGAVPNFALLNSYCRINVGDRAFCDGFTPRLSSPPLEPKRDPRVRAILSLAPIGVYFDRSALRGVTVPVDLWYGRSDELLLPPGNAENIRDNLPNRPRVTAIDGAGHFVFGPPCSAERRRAAPEICNDRRGVDRVAIKRALIDDAVSFFRASLGAP